MFAKIVVLILSLGMLAAALLANRQQRIQAAHDLALAQKRLVEHDRTLWRLRLEIASRITPAQIEIAGRRYGDLQPLRSERFHDMVRQELDAAELERDLTMNGDHLAD